MARFKEEQALARYDTLTWDDMASLTTLSHHTLPTENLLEDADGVLRAP